MVAALEVVAAALDAVVDVCLVVVVVVVDEVVDWAAAEEAEPADVEVVVVEVPTAPAAGLGVAVTSHATQKVRCRL
jgi:hypothetical protein